MRFEFSVAFKYLFPKKKNLSRSLIALMSIGVISLVVWLVLVFLSVTDGIEKNWLNKLTALHAPIQITPTNAYFFSYYHQIDTLSSASQYTAKSIAEKRRAPSADPYLPDVDSEIPPFWEKPFLNPDGNLKDLVKETFSAIEEMNKPLSAQEYEISGALMRLRLFQPGMIGYPHNQSYITQATYISSFADNSPFLHRLILEPRVEDLTHLFALTELFSDESNIELTEKISYAPYNKFQNRLKRLLSGVEINQIKTMSDWEFPHHLIPKKTHLIAYAKEANGALSYLSIPTSKNSQISRSDLKPGSIKWEGLKLVFISNEKKKYLIEERTPLFLHESMSSAAELILSSIEPAHKLADLIFHIHADIQGVLIEGQIRWKGIEITKAMIKSSFNENPSHSPLWTYMVKDQGNLPKGFEGEQGIILPKNFQSNAIHIGDKGYLSYGGQGITSVQEQRIPIFVAGFYDPGIMAVGAKAILAPASLVHHLNLTNQSFILDTSSSNGIHVWFSDLSQTQELAKQLQTSLEIAGLAPFWKVTSFYEYDFAKDLLQQFQSDKTLLILIAIIVLIVACSNIISLLIILVNDKKKEIGILQAMGASPKSIALIFALCGAVIGIISTLLGVGAAILTLHNIDSVANFLTFLQGHDAFNAVFYGASLPKELSANALIFLLVATPIIAIIAGVIPTIKACKLRPSTILRAE